MVEVLRARETLQVCVCLTNYTPLKDQIIPLPIYIILFPNSGTTFQHPSSSTRVQRDHLDQSSQLVELCKRFELSNDHMDREVSDSHINEIYPQLGKWKLVAHHLGLSGPDLEAIEHKAQGDVRLMRLYTLQEWKSKGVIDGTATYRVLLKALLKSGSSDSAVQVCRLLQRPTSKFCHVA